MRILISFLLLLSNVAGFSQRAATQPGLKLASGPLKGASVGVCVIDLGTGELLHAENADVRMVPASTLKVITGRMALDRLGADFRFRTTLAYTGQIEAGILKGDLVWSGDGDPTLGNEKVASGCAPSSVFAGILEGIRSFGISEIHGKLIIVDTLYCEEDVPRSWLWEDISNYYGAGVHGFNFMGNRYGITFARSREDGGIIPVEEIRPHPPGLQVISKVRIGPEGSGDQAYVFGGPFADKQVVRGTIPPGKGRFTIYAANHDPATLAGEMLVGFLLENGIEVTAGYHVFRELPPDIQNSGLTGMHTHESPALGEMISWMLSKSDNLVAEALLKKCMQMEGINTRTDIAAKELGTYLVEHTGDHSASFFDGSGLSPMNRMSARGMARFLGSTYRKSDFSSWLDKMPAGNELFGAANAIPDISCLMHTHLKTGSMTNVLNYSGYLRTRDGSLLGIAAFISDFDCTRNVLRKRFFEFIYQLCTQKE